MLAFTFCNMWSKTKFTALVLLVSMCFSIVSPVGSYANTGSAQGNLSYKPPSANSKGVVKMQANLNKIGDMYGSDLAFLLDSNKVEVRQKNKVILKGIGFGYHLEKDRFSGKCLFLGGPSMKVLTKNSRDKLIMKSGERFEGIITGISSKFLILKKVDGTVSILRSQIDRIISNKLIDFSVPIFPVKGTIVNNKTSFDCKTGNLTALNEPRSPNWIELTNTLERIVESGKAKSMLIIAEDVDGEALATLVVNKLRKVKKLPPKKKPIDWTKLLKKKPLPDTEIVIPIARVGNWQLVVLPPAPDNFLDEFNLPLVTNGFPLGRQQVNIPNVVNNIPNNNPQWTFQNVRGVVATKFTTFVNDHFDDLDADGNKWISKGELADAMIDPQWKGQDAVCIAILYKSLPDLQTASNDEFGFDNDGITKDDITTFGETPRKGNPWVSKIHGGLFELARSQNKATTRDLFPNGESSIVPTAVSQGYLNDCFFVATVAAVAAKDPGLIKDMIQSNGAPIGQREFTVTMPGCGPVVVKEPTDSELSLYARGKDTGLWVAVLEKAYAAHVADQDEFEDHIGTDQDCLNGGSNKGGGIRALTGGGYTSIVVSDHIDVKDNIHQSINFGLGGDRIVVMGIGKSSSGIDIEGNHLYAVTDYDSDNKILTFFNPMETEPDPGTPGVDNGTSFGDGVFKMDLDSALDVFTHVQISKNTIGDAQTIVDAFNEKIKLAAKKKNDNSPKDPSPQGGSTKTTTATGIKTTSSTPGTNGETKTTEDGGTKIGTKTDPAQGPKGGTTGGTTTHNPPPGYHVCYYNPTAIWDEKPKASSKVFPWQDVITTKDGRTIIGQIVKTTPTQIAIDQGDSILWEKKARINTLNNNPFGDPRPFGESRDLLPPKSDSTQMIAYSPDQPLSGVTFVFDDKGEPKIGNETTREPINNEKIAMTTPGAVVQPDGDAISIRQAQDSGKIKIDLNGPGNNTLKNTLSIENICGSPVKFFKPAFMFFAPSTPSAQWMANIRDPQYLLKPGEKISVEIETMCVSTKLEKPPQTKDSGLTYRLADYPKPRVAEIIVGIIKKAEALEEKNVYATVPINQALRWKKIAQTSVWKYLGSRTKRKTDDITLKSLRDDLLKGFSTPYKDMDKAKQKKVDFMVSQIMKAVDKTLRDAKVKI